MLKRTAAGRHLRGLRRNKEGYRPARIGYAKKPHKPHNNTHKKAPSPPAARPKLIRLEEDEELNWVTVACVCLGLAAIATCCVRRQQKAATRRQTKNS